MKILDDVVVQQAVLSKEEIEFNEQFRKWEEEFNKWKLANVNHPDKAAYRQYESQFEAVRQKLLMVSWFFSIGSFGKTLEAFK